MLRSQALRSLCWKPLSEQLRFTQNLRGYASQSVDANEADLDAARRWFSNFNKNTIPESISRTTFSRASGAGGQKVNKTSSKATTVWAISSLQRYVPKVLISELRSCRYYVPSSDSISIQSDTSRSQTDNTEDTHRKLMEEIKQIYKKSVPGVTSPEQKERVDQLKKSENLARLKMKKRHGDKKKARSGGRSADF
ncbi:hypothetical protein M430DRAFT_37115 [Amorphotheca resinae ATCC 22711]|uniref:Prokaryotic-type class I peptide chain release factors domain-containing protein n=1 Tax=Amorphotheca resinae ATCC 22711 TaxID=857342 RepID=A0A2T3ARH5_AMORE|nr:hypothetical protein M430DRAFT_37115 [Amorphotheca resinae ATCC 22711]PSS08971.1 hypothetical protein M430DRAFT_37115 [Amorphotheca resinae ATCC 22711]